MIRLIIKIRLLWFIWKKKLRWKWVKRGCPHVCIMCEFKEKTCTVNYEIMTGEIK